MKHLFFFMAIVFCTTSYTHAQKNETSNEPIKVSEIKREYFKDSLRLNVDISNSFWNRYDAMESREHIIHEQFKKDMEEHGIYLSPGQKIDHLTKEQQIYFIEKRMKMKEELMGLDLERFQEYKEVLPVETLILYYNLDHKFKNEMTQRYRNGSIKNTKEATAPVATPTIQKLTPLTPHPVQ